MKNWYKIYMGDYTNFFLAPTKQISINMPILKIAQRSFNLSGLDEFIVNKFKDQYIKFLSKYPDWETQYKEAKIGHINKNELMPFFENIFNLHGQPQGSIPSKINLYILNFINKKTDFDAHIIKGANKSLVLCVHIKEKNKLSTEKLYASISHELQHIIRSIYMGKLESKYYIDEQGNVSSLNDYYSDPGEIQAICDEMARDEMFGIKSIYYKHHQQNKFLNTHKSLKELYEHFKANKNNKIRDILTPHFRLFVNEIYRNKKWMMPEELRKKYMYTIYRNLDKLYDEWLNELLEGVNMSAPTSLPNNEYPDTMSA